MYLPDRWFRRYNGVESTGRDDGKPFPPDDSYRASDSVSGDIGHFAYIKTGANPLDILALTSYTRA